jgi:hypothetical protein
VLTALQQREGEANTWRKWLTLSYLLFIQRHNELQCTRVSVILVDAPCQPVHIYLLHCNSILLSDCIIVMVKVAPCFLFVGG